MTDDRYARGGEVAGPLHGEGIPVRMTPGEHVVTRAGKVFLVVDQS